MNTKSVLLAYATRYGSTQEVAETIANELRLAGLEIELQPMSEVKTLDGYTAVILGAAIYSAHWHPQAHDFLVRHQEALRQRPVVLFTLGPLSSDHAAMQRSRRQLDKELEKYTWLQPVTQEIFAGKYDPAKLNFFGKLLPSIDRRDWNAIRAWANVLPARLQQAEIFSLA